MLRIPIRLFFGAFLIVLSCASAAQGQTAREVLKHCESKDAIDLAYCYGLVRGYFDAFDFAAIVASYRLTSGASEVSQEEQQMILKRLESACIPKSVSTEQAAAVVVKYLRDNPSQWHEYYSVVLAAAIVDAFPCPR